MLIQTKPAIPASAITDEAFYLRRRDFIKLAAGAVAAATAAPLIGCGGDRLAAESRDGGSFGSAQSPLGGYKERAIATDEKLNTFDEITGYNNFFEFGMGKGDPKRFGGSLKTSPWKVKVDGLCNKPADYHLEDLIKPIGLEERIYRLRCVEAWSMVIPWIGIPLASVIDRAEPSSTAAFG